VRRAGGEVAVERMADDDAEDERGARGAAREIVVQK
jgi:hypothetical protein